MRLRRRPDEHEYEREEDPRARSDDQLRELHDEGDGFLAAADEAIRKALSSDSEAFLRQNRQRSGQ